MVKQITVGESIVYAGSNLDILPTLADNSVDSIVCDPPYELGFMGKSWDSSGIAYSVELWKECLRVLKPGGHLLAFGGTRTWHRLAVAIEDAGFEIRDNIAWLYGSGFPKSHNISKAIDKLHGAERKVIGQKITGNARSDDGWHGGQITIEETSSATDDAKKWDGWGTALKPAHEPIVVARKPLIGTVAENVLTYGVGGLNIDASRVDYQSEADQASATPQGRVTQHVWYEDKTQIVPRNDNTKGRWPANIILDETTAELLDEQSGIRPGMTSQRNSAGKNIYGGNAFNKSTTTFPEFREGYNDIGGASRFFYVAKASKRDRNEGLEEVEGKEIGSKGNGLARTCNTCGATVLDGCECPDRTFSNPVRKNFHPTVKPTTLMAYLIKLVTPPNGIVLDPFAGSGSTGKAAILNGFKFIGIELTEDYLPIIEGRLNHAYQTYLSKEDDLFE